MGGYGSGRSGGRPTVESCLRIDLAWMFRKGSVQEGCRIHGSLNWSRGNQPSGSIGYVAIMDEPGEERLELTYTRGSGEDREDVRQTVRLTHSQPHYGGRRWWMVCPYRHNRVGKLYLPPGGDRFAGRRAWRLAYSIQRVEHRQRPFEALFKLQRKLGCDAGWDAGLYRPKGMWRRTFDRHWQRYLELDDRCALEAAGLIGLLDKR